MGPKFQLNAMDSMRRFERQSFELLVALQGSTGDIKFASEDPRKSVNLVTRGAGESQLDTIPDFTKSVSGKAGEGLL